MAAADRPDPAWLRALLTAHRTGVGLRDITAGGKPGMSKAELGGLLRGAQPVEEAVFRLRFLGQEQHWDRVFEALSLEAARLKARREFSAVHCDDCLTRLVSLVVQEERLPEHHHNSGWRARYMGVSRSAWRWRYDRAHAVLKDQLEQWANKAVACAKANLYETAE